MYGFVLFLILVMLRNLLWEFVGIVLEDVVQILFVMVILGSQFGLLGSLLLIVVGVVFVELVYENLVFLIGIMINVIIGLDEVFEVMQYGNIVSLEEFYYYWIMLRSIIFYED